MPDESPVITFGWRVRNWKKTPEGLFTAFSPHAVCDLWQRTPLERYLKVNSAELVESGKLTIPSRTFMTSLVIRRSCAPPKR